VIGYIVLAAFLVPLGIWTYNLSQETSRLATENRRLIAEVANTCTDPKAAAALRRQWARVAEIIDHTAPQAKPGEPGYIPPERAGKLFADSYKQAIREAGPAPDCRDLLP
jgi:hypothetical protein